MPYSSGLPVDYDEAAWALSAPLCDQTCALESLARHTSGYVDPLYVHWKRRAVTRRGLWLFTKLVVRQRLGVSYTRLVERLWIENTEAYALGIGDLGIRFPREFAATDRARVRAELAVAGDRMAIDTETRERITRWARD